MRVTSDMGVPLRPTGNARDDDITIAYQVELDRLLVEDARRSLAEE